MADKKTYKGARRKKEKEERERKRELQILRLTLRFATLYRTLLPCVSKIIRHILGCKEHCNIFQIYKQISRERRTRICMKRFTRACTIYTWGNRDENMKYKKKTRTNDVICVCVNYSLDFKSNNYLSCHVRLYKKLFITISLGYRESLIVHRSELIKNTMDVTERGRLLS